MKAATGRSKRTILKIISVFTAIILWLFITYTEDSQMNVNIGSIDIQLTGEDYLNEQGFMVINKSVIPKASAVVRGKRRDIINIMDSISAAVDVSEVTEAGSYKLKPVFDIPSNSVYLSKQRTASVDIEIEKIEEKTIDVRVVQNNADENKSLIVESASVKKTFVIKGAADDLENIDHVSVYVDVSKITKEGGILAEPVLENDENTEVITTNDIFMESKDIEVVNSIYERCTLPVNVTAGISDRYGIEIIEQSVTNVDAGIKNDAGRSITSLTNFPISGELKFGTNEYELILDIPEGIYVPEEKKKIKVKLEVFERSEAVVNVPVTVKNTKGRKYELNRNEIEVWISGPAEKLKSNYISAVIDIDSLISSEEEQLVTAVVATSEKDISIKNYSSEILLKVRD